MRRMSHPLSPSLSLSLFLIVSLSVGAPQHVSAHLPRLSRVSHSLSLLISLSRVLYFSHCCSSPFLLLSTSMLITLNWAHAPILHYHMALKM